MKAMSSRVTLVALVWVLGVTALPVHADDGYKPRATVLKRVDSVHLHADGSKVMEVESLVRIDTETAAEDWGEQRLDYSESLETAEVLEAWTQTPDGKRIPVTPDRIRTLQAHDEGGVSFNDDKVQVLIYPAVTVGAHVYLRWRVHQHTPYFAGRASWGVEYPPGMVFEDARVTIRHDAGMAVKVDARGLDGGLVPQKTNAAEPPTVRYAYTFRQTKAWPPERSRVALSDFAAGIDVTTFDGWPDLARAYQAGARRAAEPTPAIRQLAAELTAGAADDRERVRRLHEWVSRQIRYLALHVSTGGYVPHDAQKVLDHRYGDCKDHVAILEALLRAVGIESTPALVNASQTMKLPRLATLNVFDHVITYVPSLDLYLDATARFAPMGTLPEEVMDKPVLLTASGKVARTPRTTPQNNQTHTRAWMQLSDTGEVWGTTVATMRGPNEVDSRASQFDNKRYTADTLARRYLARFGESGNGQVDMGDPLDLSKPWELTATFELDPVVNIPGPAAMTIPIGLAPGRFRGLAQQASVGERRFDYVCTSANLLEETELRMPHNVRIQRIPPPVKFQRGPLRYTAEYKRSGNLVTIRRHFIADRPSHTCTPADEEDWQAFLAVLRRDLRGQVFVK